MVKTLLLLSPVLTGAWLLLAGHLDRLKSAAPETAAPTFVAQPLPADFRSAAEGVSAAELLAAATDRLAPEKQQWLRAGLWQRMVHPELTFEAEGTLQRGPRACARLDLRVRTGRKTGRRLVVSDGHVLACVQDGAAGKPDVKSYLLKSPEMNPEQRLRDEGAAGPHALLSELRGKLQELTLQPGVLAGRRVVRVKGTLPEATESPASASFCYLYLDAGTLWPCRAEWWSAPAGRPVRLTLEIEFRDPELGRELSRDACVAAFSYDPVPPAPRGGHAKPQAAVAR